MKARSDFRTLRAARASADKLNSAIGPEYSASRKAAMAVEHEARMEALGLRPKQRSVQELLEMLSHATRRLRA